ncbi:hypothetical protein AVEN_18180-1 [Araneus ventricosus]|uniref:Uncharacterized protein n=1 Tax=Araneus ventricosus TaxID=182803 RepID=A0A4Y2AKA1_ARAVE|nr:hypothetical protein AVEN_18180-1 [Araneus ventricosus]
MVYFSQRLKVSKKCNMPSLDNEASFASSKNNAKLSRSSSVQSHREQAKERRGSPSSQAVTSRLDQKRQKIRTAYAKRSGQQIEQSTSLNEKPRETRTAR